MRRILLATFGSGGDVAPLVPIADQLRAQGNEVSFVVPRSLALYVRATGAGFACFGTGNGSELAFLRDDALFTARFSGWASHRRTVVQYVAPRLRNDVSEIRAIIRRWSPDIVVTMTYAVAARIAALAEGVPHVVCSIYPQYFALAGRHSIGFARSFVREVHDVCPRGILDDYGLNYMAWGIDEAGILLHDPWLVEGANLPASLDITGYPYYDALLHDEEDEARAQEWLAARGPTVVVTLGSFLPLSESARAWAGAAAAVRACGARALLVNTRPQTRDRSGSASGVLSVGYVPLSRIVRRAAAVVHHGGIGTMFAALRAGRPAAVIPQAFDQPFNADLVARTGTGIASTSATLADDLQSVMHSRRVLSEAAKGPGRVIPCEVAARRAADSILIRASSEPRVPALR